MSTVFIDTGLASGDNDGTTWENAYQDLQAGIDGAGAGDEVWVKGRTVTLSARIDVDNANANNIFGGFATDLTGTSGSVAGRTLPTNATVLDGNASVTCLSITKTCTFDGFKIYNGSGSPGGLVIATASINPTISNCGFYNNVGTYQGAAVLISSAGTVTFDTCVFDTNTGSQYGGALALYGGAVTLSSCTFNANNCVYNGSAIRTSTGTTLIATDCIFTSNAVTTGAYATGGALYIYNGTAATFTRCKISGSTNGASTWGGGLCLEGTPATVVNCIITGNTAAYGGGILCTAADTYTFTNCTIAGNTCTTASGGGGIRNRVSAVTNMANCIIYGNVDDADADNISNAATITVTYSDVEGGFTGTGNVNANPNFKTTGDDPYDLASTSACVDSANAGATSYPTTDYLGRARVDDPATSNTGAGSPAYSDMGAYEFQVAIPPEPPAVIIRRRSMLFAFNE